MIISLAAASTVLAAPAAAPPFRGPVLAMDRVLAPATETLQVSVPMLTPSGALPILHTGYGKNLSPLLAWTPGPRGTKAYVVIIEDADSHTPQPALHWLAYNIPANMTAIGKGQHNRSELTGEHGFLQGKNSAGGIGYVGPNPPVGESAHHYHIQVFALGRPLPLPGGAGLDQVLSAMNDRVVAEGELVVTFEAPRPDTPKVAGPKASKP